MPGIVMRQPRDLEDILDIESAATFVSLAMGVVQDALEEESMPPEYYDSLSSLLDALEDVERHIDEVLEKTEKALEVAEGE